MCPEKGKEDEKPKEEAPKEDLGEDDDDDMDKDEGSKISRKKLRKMNRLTVAELKQVCLLYVVFIIQELKASVSKRYIMSAVT